MYGNIEDFSVIYDQWSALRLPLSLRDTSVMASVHEDGVYGLWAISKILNIYDGGPVVLLPEGQLLFFFFFAKDTKRAALWQRMEHTLAIRVVDERKPIAFSSYQ